jgi:hypothetical protein
MNMEIVVLGWGSLVFDHERNFRFGFEIEVDWKSDGPYLPIEFARKSYSTKGGNMRNRLTLVIYPNATNVPVLWAKVKEKDLPASIDKLAKRESSNKIDNIVLESDWDCLTLIEEIIVQWAHSKIEESEEIDAIIWTALESNFKRYSILNSR